MFDFPLQIASIQLYFAVLLGMLWGGNPAKAEHHEEPLRAAQSSSLSQTGSH